MTNNMKKFNTQDSVITTNGSGFQDWDEDRHYKKTLLGINLTIDDIIEWLS